MRTAIKLLLSILLMAPVVHAACCTLSSSTNGVNTACSSCTSNNLAILSPATGDALYLYMTYQSSQSVSTITDSQGNTWSVSGACSTSSNVACRAAHHNPTGSFFRDIYCFPNAASNASDTITVTLGGSSSVIWTGAVSFTGGSCELDANAGATCTNNVASGATTFSCSSALVTNASVDLLLAQIATTGNSPTVASPWTNAVTPTGAAANLVLYYLVTAASGTQNNAFGTQSSGGFDVRGVAFQPAAPPPAGGGVIGAIRRRKVRA